MRPRATLNNKTEKDKDSTSLNRGPENWLTMHAILFGEKELQVSKNITEPLSAMHEAECKQTCICNGCGFNEPNLL